MNITMNRQTRRAFFSVLGLGAAGAALAGCITTSTSGGATSVTVDVSKALSYASTGVQVATAAMAIPAVASALAALGLTAQAQTALLAVTAAYAAIKAVTASTGTSITLTVDTATFQTKVQSLITALGQVLALIQQVLGKFTGTIVTDVQNAISAIQTVLPFLSLTAGLASVTAAGLPTDTDAAKAQQTATMLSLKYGVPLVQ